MDSTSSDGWMRVLRKIDDGKIGFLDPAPITQGGTDVPNFILADDALA